MAFRHEPMTNSNSIRLFTLYSGKFDDELAGAVGAGTFPSPDCPSYYFLSYAWKDASEAGASLPLARSDRDWDRRDNSRTIKINEQPFRICHNLALALLHIRSPTQPQCFWIDAICINLEDDDERSSQYCLMPAIVARAEAVVAWLGPDDPEQFQELRSDEDKWVRMKINWDRGKIKFLPNILCKLTGANLESTPRRFIQTVSLVRNGYWNRLWTLHELCNAKRVFFVSGKNVWREEDIDSCKDSFGTLPITTTLNARRHRDKKFSLEALLLKYHSYESDKQLDLVYALVGLSSDIWATPPNHIQNGNSSKSENGVSLLHLTIDYKKTPYEV
ncbi:heterokaryon incompatibility protein [Colletotrichum tofieldiae]|uniref:Heterokaryon incompatibility protein n=1 Tax=Colletotrichum tofieldiae TaxID=708197 RepID=A0A166Z9J9_9PEZI|nr:heterokaryon incompatibility protein [Colletotrichum tofieldiae]GKT55841.1 heterokaryon incompatibility protein [Colletotrichum tofieldiae]GKT79321.1 heterokaryon incompatibility protein [Colletotrichum tofieldiae]GKT82491.1 heterokaryon incompatibility protein [Colletotrichum tofieldiae]